MRHAARLVLAVICLVLLSLSACSITPGDKCGPDEYHDEICSGDLVLRCESSSDGTLHWRVEDECFAGCTESTNPNNGKPIASCN